MANAYCDIAVIYEEYGIPEKAIDYYKMAIQLQQPTHYNACLNLANILYRLKINMNDALTYYEKALECDNTSVEIYIHMGNIYEILNKSEDALRCFYMAIQNDPHCIEAYIYIGSIQKNTDNFTEAIRAYEFVLKLNPDLSDVYCNLVQCLQKICDWSDYDAHMKKLQEIVNKQLNDDDMLSLLPHDAFMFPLSIEVQTKIASKYAQHCVEKLKNSIEEPQQFVHPTSLISSNESLRIGFVSTNFGKHPITTIMESLSNIICDYQIDVICYSISSNDNIPSW